MTFSTSMEMAKGSFEKASFRYNPHNILISETLFKLPGVAGACIQSQGQRHDRNGVGGDAVLLDFKTGFFAVADGSDRYPGAAARVLKAFDDMVSRNINQNDAYENKTGFYEHVVRRVQFESERILSELHGRVGSTFTGFQLLRTKKDVVGLIMHTGDSELWEYNREFRKLKRLTRSNFWMVGRTHHLYQVELVPLKNKCTYLLVSDGVNVFNHLRAEESNAQIDEIFKHTEVANIPEKIIEMQSACRDLTDDAVVVAFNTPYDTTLEDTFILGDNARTKPKIPFTINSK